MGLLGFGEKNPPASAPGGGSGAGAPGTAEVRQNIRKARDRASRVGDQAAATFQAQELDQLYEGANWEEVANIYFETRFAITGWEDFRLTESEKARLGVSLAATMRLLIQLDPAYVALLVFCVNFGSIIAKKEVLYKRERKMEEVKAAGDGHGS